MSTLVCAQPWNPENGIVSGDQKESLPHGNEDSSETDLGLAFNAKSYYLSCLREFLKLSRFYQFNLDSREEAHRLLEKSVLHWLQVSGAVEEINCVKFVKYKLSAFLAYHIGNSELPTFNLKGKDHPAHLLGGRHYCWQRRFKSKDPDGFLSFICSVNLLKKGLPRPSIHCVHKEVIKTFESLTSPPPQEYISIPDGLHVDVQSYLPLLVNSEIICVTQDVFSGNSDYSSVTNKLISDCDDSHRSNRTSAEIMDFIGRDVLPSDGFDFRQTRPFFPSTSASYFTPRSEGGICADLAPFVPDDDNLDLDYVHVGSASSMGLKFVYDVRLASWFRSDLDDSRVEIHRDVNPRRSFLLDDSLFRLKFYSFYNNVYDSLVSNLDVPKVKLIGLSEALKVRIISAGPAKYTFVLKPLQEKMRAVLVERPTFLLIGQPDSAYIINKYIGGLLGFSNDFGFASLDFSSATDGLYSHHSELCATVISDCLNLRYDEFLMFRNLLTRHSIGDPNDMIFDDFVNAYRFPPSILGRLPIRFKPQQRGQLMGSVVSFPILCLLNASCCRFVFDTVTYLKKYCRSDLDKPIPEIFSSLNVRHFIKFRRTSSLSQLPLLINGDDAVMKICNLGYRLWKYVCPYFGFTPSIGKTYFSKDILQINSRNYKYDKLLNCFTVPKCINMGLVSGMQRSTSAALDVKDIKFSPASRMQEISLNMPDHCDSAMVLGCYFNNISKYLLGYNLPYFIPEKFGGLGLIGRPRKLDVAYCLGMAAMRGQFKLPPVFKTEETWITRRMVQKTLDYWKSVSLLPNVEKRFLSKEEEDMASGFSGRLCALLFADREFSFKLVEDLKDNFAVINMKNAMRHLKLDYEVGVPMCIAMGAFTQEAINLYANKPTMFQQCMKDNSIYYMRQFKNFFRSFKQLVTKVMDFKYDNQDHTCLLSVRSKTRLNSWLNGSEIQFSDISSDGKVHNKIVDAFLDWLGEDHNLRRLATLLPASYDYPLFMRDTFRKRFPEEFVIHGSPLQEPCIYEYDDSELSFRNVGLHPNPGPNSSLMIYYLNLCSEYNDSCNHYKLMKALKVRQERIYQILIDSNRLLRLIRKVEDINLWIHDVNRINQIRQYLASNYNIDLSYAMCLEFSLLELSPIPDLLA